MPRNAGTQLPMQNKTHGTRLGTTTGAVISPLHPHPSESQCVSSHLFRTHKFSALVVTAVHPVIAIEVCEGYDKYLTYNLHHEQQQLLQNVRLAQLFL